MPRKRQPVRSDDEVSIDVIEALGSLLLAKDSTFMTKCYQAIDQEVVKSVSSYCVSFNALFRPMLELQYNGLLNFDKINEFILLEFKKYLEQVCYDELSTVFSDFSMILKQQPEANLWCLWSYWGIYDSSDMSVITDCKEIECSIQASVINKLTLLIANKEKTNTLLMEFNKKIISKLDKIVHDKESQRFYDFINIAPDTLAGKPRLQKP